MKKIYLFIISFLFLIITTQHSAKEILIYANSINYDSQSNIIGKGNVKIISGNEIIMSDLIIINEETDKITLPVNFSYKDNKNNYYFGSSGEFTKNFENGTINDVKILLNDGSRIVGKKALKTGKTDLINKGVYIPPAPLRKDIFKWNEATKKRGGSPPPVREAQAELINVYKSYVGAQTGQR